MVIWMNCFWFLPHRRSRCRARCGPEPRWTYRQLQPGSHSHDTSCWRVRCNLTERQTERRAQLKARPVTPELCENQDGVFIPFSQYGSPSSMWKRLFPNALPQAAHTKQVVCHVCRRACITSCNTQTWHRLRRVCVNYKSYSLSIIDNQSGFLIWSDVSYMWLKLVRVVSKLSIQGLSVKK